MHGLISSHAWYARGTGLALLCVMLVTNLKDNDLSYIIWESIGDGSANKLSTA